MNYVIFEGHYNEKLFNNEFTLEKICIANLKKSIPYCLIKLYNKKLGIRRKLYYEGKVDFNEYYNYAFIIINVKHFLNNKLFEIPSNRKIILDHYYFFVEKLKNKYNDHLTFTRNTIYHSFFKNNTILTIELELIIDKIYKSELNFSAIVKKLNYNGLTFDFLFSSKTFYEYMAFSGSASYQNAGSILYNNLYEVCKDTLSNLKQFNEFKEIWIYILSNFIRNVENEKTKLYTSKEYETIEIIDDYLSKAEKVLNFIKNF